jgi:hypothetical protein
MSPSDALDADIESFGRPDLITPRGCRVYRNRVLLAITTRLLLLEKFGARDALALFTRVTMHLYTLHYAGMLTRVELDLGLADLRRHYERAQPALLDLLPDLDD